MSSSRQSVRFPPGRHSDLVLHYRDTDFYVHKLVLEPKSEYFRAHFQSDDVAVPGEGCVHSHPSVPHCLTVPDDLSQLLVPDVRFQVPPSSFALFLEHLYYPSHYCFPPYLPRVHLRDAVTEEDDQAALISLSPAYDKPVSVAAIEQYGLEPEKDALDLEACDSLVPLFHHFQCGAALGRAMSCILAMCAQSHGARAFYWLAKLSASRLSIPGKPGMAGGWEETLIQLAARDFVVVFSTEFRDMAKELSHDALLRLAIAVRDQGDRALAAAKRSAKK